MSNKNTNPLKSVRDAHLEILKGHVTKIEKEFIQSFHKNVPEHLKAAFKPYFDEIVNEMLVVNSLISAMKAGGKVKTLIIINESGEAFDLLDLSKLNKHNVFDKIIDNFKE